MRCVKATCGQNRRTKVLRYCCPRGLSANPARRNASAIASPLLDSAVRRRFSDLVAAIPADSGAGRVSGA